MEPEAILRRLEEIEDHMEAAKRLESPPAEWSDTAWLCQVVRQLIARLKRSETVAEAARDLVSGLGVEMDDPRLEYVLVQVERSDLSNLRSTLTALEEGGK